MSIIESVASRGSNVTSSLGGSLNINEANGEITIRNGTTVVVRIDREGFKYYDDSGVQRISFGQNADGQQQFIVNDSDGIPQILIGQDPKDGSPVIANSTPGRNVISDLMAG